MTTRRFFFQRTALLSLLALPMLFARRAQATGLPVVDLGSIAQLIVQVTQTIAQIEATRQQVVALKNAARQLDPSSYRSVESLLSGNDLNYASLTRDVSSIGYTLERVNDQFHRLFPNEEAVRDMRPSDFEGASRDMNREIYSSGLVAARAQTTLRTIEANNTEAQNILSRSEGNDSQVAQLQSALQMLALMHQNLVTINQTISSAGRVSSDIAVSAVTERRMARERQRRLLVGHDRRSTSPGLDRRFLQGDSW